MIYGREKAKVPVTAIITSVMPKLSATTKHLEESNEADTKN